MNNISDRSLIISLQHGDLDALGILFDRHRQMVYRTALGIVGDSEVAADLLQEVFLRFHRFSHKVDPERPLKPWLYRATVNLTSTWLKRRRWLRPLEDIAEWFVGDNKNAPHSAAELAEDQLRIQHAITSLPLSQRTVVVMYYLNDLSIQEISEVLEIPEGTVKSRLHYGRQLLKQHLSSQRHSTPGPVYEFT